MDLPLILGISVFLLAAAAQLVRRALKAQRGMIAMQFLSNFVRGGMEIIRRSMRACLGSACSPRYRLPKLFAASVALALLGTTRAFAQPPEAHVGEADLRLPDFTQVQFLGISGHSLLMIGILFCVFGLLFGLAIYSRLKNLPVHRAMAEISQLIWETCKTYLIQQGKFLLLLWAFIAAIIVLYFGVLLKYEVLRVVIILFFSMVGIGGSYGVAWFGIRVNTFANSRTAFASLGGKPFPVGRLRRAVFHRLRHRRVTGRVGAAHRRRHLHQDC
jgi:K(+)-stimulated pyrophosphate-energized sodium pump